MAAASICRRTWDFMSALFLLVGSILFVVGAVGSVRSPTNPYTAPAYLACAISFLIGGIIMMIIYSVELVCPRPALDV